MKKYFIFILVLSCSCQSKYERKASKSDCDKFKTGKFFHSAKGDPTLYRIERTDSVQTEFIGKTGDYANLKIKWTGPCMYELTFLNQHMLGVDSVPDEYKSLKVKVEILNIRNDTCFVIADDGSHKTPGVVYIDN